MKLVQMRCPNCKATLDVQNGIDTFFCTYCGTPLMLDGQSKSALKAKVRIMEMEHEERIQDRRFEHEERTQRNKYNNEAARWSRKHKSDRFDLKKKVVLIIAPFVALMLYFIIMFSWIDRPSDGEKKHNAVIEELKELDKEIEEDILHERYDDALVKANRLRADGYSTRDKDIWDEKRETYISIIKDRQKDSKPNNVSYISAPVDSEEFKNYTVDEAAELLREAGFNDIDREETTGSAGFFAKDHLVEHLLINGRSNFNAGDSFPEDSHIVIYYYM